MENELKVNTSHTKAKFDIEFTKIQHPAQDSPLPPANSTEGTDWAGSTFGQQGLSSSDAWNPLHSWVHCGVFYGVQSGRDLQADFDFTVRYFNYSIQ